MRFSVALAAGLLWLAADVAALPGPRFIKRAAQFLQGQPIDGDGRGGPILGT